VRRRRRRRRKEKRSTEPRAEEGVMTRERFGEPKSPRERFFAENAIYHRKLNNKKKRDGGRG